MHVFIAVEDYNMTQVKLPLHTQLKLFESKVAAYRKLPIFKSASTLREEKALKELLGLKNPFKRTSVADLEKTIDDPAGLAKSAEAGVGAMKSISDAEKKLGSLKKIGLSDYARVETAVDDYIDNLVNLYGTVQRYDENPEVQKRATELFTKTKQMMAALQKALQDGMAKLTNAVPAEMFSSKTDFEGAARQSAVMRTPGQQLGAMARSLVTGAGGGPGAPRR